jgi:hypothetical protein
MVLDLDTFRDDKGGDLKKVRLNQEKRFKDLNLVETVVAKGRFRFSQLFVTNSSSIFHLRLFKTRNGAAVASRRTTSTSSRMSAARRSASG